jgi:hypothetical protein
VSVLRNALSKLTTVALTSVVTLALLLGFGVPKNLARERFVGLSPLCAHGRVDCDTTERRAWISQPSSEQCGSLVLFVVNDWTDDLTGATLCLGSGVTAAKEIRTTASSDALGNDRGEFGFYRSGDGRVVKLEQLTLRHDSRDAFAVRCSVAQPGSTLDDARQQMLAAIADPRSPFYPLYLNGKPVRFGEVTSMTHARFLLLLLVAFSAGLGTMFMANWVGNWVKARNYQLPDD